jgi:anti-sigma regulatory factor (Ser/Thr protein kinase)
LGIVGTREPWGMVTELKDSVSAALRESARGSDEGLRVSHRFPATDLGVRDARRWVRRVVPEWCAAGDDFGLVVSELGANAATHGGGGFMTLTVVHGPDGLAGELVHHAEPIGNLPAVFCELALTTGFEPPVVGATLSEGGRGLLLVANATGLHLTLSRGQTETSIGWLLNGCRCGERSTGGDAA